MLIDIMVGFLVGALFVFISYIIFYNDKSLSKVQLDDYYKSQYESQYFKEEYDKLHFILEHLNDEDIELCRRDKYNHFIIKKEKKFDLKEIRAFNDLDKMP